jgi:hypothetical protein
VLRAFPVECGCSDILNSQARVGIILNVERDEFRRTAEYTQKILDGAKYATTDFPFPTFQITCDCSVNCYYYYYYYYYYPHYFLSYSVSMPNQGQLLGIFISVAHGIQGGCGNGISGAHVTKNPPTC